MEVGTPVDARDLGGWTEPNATTVKHQLTSRSPLPQQPAAPAADSRVSFWLNESDDEDSEQIPVSYFTVNGSWAALVDSWYQDPPGFHVTEIENYVEWYPISGCAVDPNKNSIAWDQESYLALSGWVAEETPFTFSAHFGCDYAESHTTLTFVNDVFCASLKAGLGDLAGAADAIAHPTTVVANDNSVRGYADTTSSYTENWTKDGGCNDLLSFNFTTR